MILLDECRSDQCLIFIMTEISFYKLVIIDNKHRRMISLISET